MSRQEKVLCSEVVTWLSEYRIYIVHSEIRRADHYASNAQIPIHLREVHRAIQALDRIEEPYVGYAIDFGVLASGQTTLAEMNNGFAIGAYSIDRKNYTHMIWAR